MDATTKQPVHAGYLPPETLSRIFEALGDWELSTRMGIPTRLPIPPEWEQTIKRLDEHEKSLEWVFLTGSISDIGALLRTRPEPRWLPDTCVRLVFKFAWIKLLNYLVRNHVTIFFLSFGNTVLPTGASTVSPRVDMLEWWRRAFPVKQYTAQAIEMAKKSGSVGVVDWWKKSGLQLYSVNPPPENYHSSLLRPTGVVEQLKLPSQCCSFLDLPRRLREGFYILSLRSQATIQIWDPEFDKQEYKPYDPKMFRVDGLLAVTCAQVSQETIPRLYGFNRFVFGGGHAWSHLLVFLHAIGAENRQLLRFLEMRVQDLGWYSQISGCLIRYEILEKEGYRVDLGARDLKADTALEGCLRLLSGLRAISINLAFEDSELSEFHLRWVWPRIISCWYNIRVVLRSGAALPPILKTLVDDKSWSLNDEIPTVSAGQEIVLTHGNSEIREIEVLLVPIDEDCRVPMSRGAAMISYAIEKSILEAPPDRRQIVFKTKINRVLLERITKWCEDTFRNIIRDPEDCNGVDGELLENHGPHLIQVIAAADTLRIPALSAMATIKLAIMVRGKDPADIRQILNLPDDLDAKQKNDIRTAHGWSFRGVDTSNAKW
ncbi:MAG: hypothetical protein M1840_005229 [Geoglossum simile]|nr:MAG: hypothetical protein M1840_005229 [Geoglossum simile]